eukprot:3725476-Rhodomonas_salina.1
MYMIQDACSYAHDSTHVLLRTCSCKCHPESVDLPLTCSVSPTTLHHQHLTLFSMRPLRLPTRSGSNSRHPITVSLPSNSFPPDARRVHLKLGISLAPFTPPRRVRVSARAPQVPQRARRDAPKASVDG